MKDETKIWLKYADENLSSARVLLDNNLFNPCLQNIQQSVEKSLKALVIESSAEFRRTHSINELKMILVSEGIMVDLTEDECDLLDSVYLPSKYPISSALPYFEPDPEICREYISVAEKVNRSVKTHIQDNEVEES
ncbi:MAG: HEPN domain-containing protein [Desulfobacteraceae bacterium]|nr:HEPN domain-containing protein [Desulfobacteraceae bacterium]MCP4347962.1 HEPN domain-containing protein [Desulfobacterales bacterium]